jgi:ArsR family transcriptional regulator, arsenate/arsenite/antimonite-responsive transcriptional repressor
LKEASDDLQKPRADGETGGPAATPEAPQNTKDETIMPINVAEPKARSRQYRFPEIPGRLEKDLVQVFKLLSDETRLRVLMYLAREGELHVTALCEKLDQSQPAVSHHLALLRVAGLIEARRDGKHNYYSVRQSRFHGLMEELFHSISDPNSDEVRFDEFVLTYDNNGN